MLLHADFVHAKAKRTIHIEFTFDAIRNELVSVSVKSKSIEFSLHNSCGQAVALA